MSDEGPAGSRSINKYPHAGITKNALSLIGNTPLVKLSKITDGLGAQVLAKLEWFNPLGSIKDRTALSMITTAEKEGKLKEGGTVIEATSGNTGIGLAFICAIKGYKCVITMPDNMSKERVQMLKALGAQVVQTPGYEGMQGAVKEAERLAEGSKGSFLTRQFENKANPQIHRLTTAEEIWRDTGAKVDIVVCGIGTGGTITGIAEALKEKNKDIKIIGVEPSESAVISGHEAGIHGIQGIGAGFAPKLLKRELIDEIITISTDEAVDMAKRLAKEEGLLAGISSGAAAFAAQNVAGRGVNKGRVIVTIFPDSGERYLSSGFYG